MKQYWTPDKVTALILVIGLLVLLLRGIDSEVKSMLAVAVGWLFGGAYSVMKEKKKNQTK